MTRRRLIVGLLATSAPGVFAGMHTRPPGGITPNARQLLLERIDMIEGTASCRMAFAEQRIDLQRVRELSIQARFYAATGEEAKLRFSQIVGRPANPDETLEELAAQVGADAFVLGYFDRTRYVRTLNVVLNRGYFEQNGKHGLRTTREEKQALLLHEMLHIALNKDDDALNGRELCPFRLLSFCPAEKPEKKRTMGRNGEENGDKME